MGVYFAGAFIAWFLHQIEHNLHETDPLQFLYNPDDVKRSTQAALMIARRQRRWREEVNSGSLFLQIWQLRKATLSQRLGSFPTKLRAEILPRCRRDYPLPPPINRGWVDGLREEKFRSKIWKKPAPIAPVSAVSPSLSPPLQPPPPSSPPAPPQ